MCGAHLHEGVLAAPAVGRTALVSRGGERGWGQYYASAIHTQASVLPNEPYLWRSPFDFPRSHPFVTFFSLPAPYPAYGKARVHRAAHRSAHRAPLGAHPSRHLPLGTWLRHSGGRYLGGVGTWRGRYPGA